MPVIKITEIKPSFNQSLKQSFRLINSSVCATVYLPTGETFALEKSLLSKIKFKIFNEQQVLIESRRSGWLPSRHHELWFGGAAYGRWRYIKSSIAGSSYENQLLGFEVESSGGGQTYAVRKRDASANSIHDLVNTVYEVNAGVNQYLIKVRVSNAGGELNMKADFEVSVHPSMQVFTAARLWLDHYSQLALS